MDSYVTSILFGNCDEQRLSNIIDAVRSKFILKIESTSLNFYNFLFRYSLNGQICADKF